MIRLTIAMVIVVLVLLRRPIPVAYEGTQAPFYENFGMGAKKVYNGWRDYSLKSLTIANGVSDVGELLIEVVHRFDVGCNLLETWSS